ncbi:hypothetical protein R1flu_011744 [Riccia fluitans]|uniref:Uncharacterized protein n=1 Tax=Riccia fluitans TaxID=41844 RepID=A0ABD1Z8N0_9MARC
MQASLVPAVQLNSSERLIPKLQIGRSAGTVGVTDSSSRYGGGKELPAHLGNAENAEASSSQHGLLTGAQGTHFQYPM